MSKADRKRDLIVRIAKEPWQHSVASLAEVFGVDATTIARDLKQLSESGFSFAANDSGRLYLSQSGSLRQAPAKDPIIRQLEILRFVASDMEGKSHGEIVKWYASHCDLEISERTLERAIKELRQKDLVVQEGEKYKVNPAKVVSHLFLEAKEKALLLEALALAEGVAPLPDEAKSVATLLKRLVSKGESNKRSPVYVHGRSPVYDLTVSNFCRQIEGAARSQTKLRLLYRKLDEPASERIVKPLGLVYYWVLDKWYLVTAAEAGAPAKTYSLDHILLCEETGENFERPQGFELKEHFKHAWGIFRGDEPTAVKVRFRDYFSVPQRVREELSHRETCQLTETEEGLIMTDRVQGLEEFAVWLRGFGPAVEVIEPAELRQKVVQELRRTLAGYEEGEA